MKTVERKPLRDRIGRRAPKGSPLRIGWIALMLAAVLAVALSIKPTLETALTPGDTLSAEFPENYLGKIFPNETTVKLSGIETGRVTGVDYTDHHTAVVRMKVDSGVLDQLGPRPSATVTPRTLLGGLYSIELIPGGGPGSFPDGGSIPLDRTSLPVGVDRILETLPKPTRQATQGVLDKANRTLAEGGSAAIARLLREGPPTLGPANDVLQAVQGTNKGVDLPRLVTNLERFTTELTRNEGQLGAIMDDLSTTTRVLAARSRPLADTVATLPATLRETRDGVSRLDGTLDKLTTTAESFRPSVKELDPLLENLDPVLAKAGPLVADLRPLLADAKPAVEQLVPVSERGTAVLDDIRGPVLDRVQGPILHTVMNTWRGTGPYQGSGGGWQADHKFYEEIGYLVTNLDRGSKTQDAQGSLLSFQVGVGPLTSVAGLQNVNLPDLVEQLGRAAGVVPPVGPPGAKSNPLGALGGDR